MYSVNSQTAIPLNDMSYFNMKSSGKVRCAMCPSHMSNDFTYVDSLLGRSMPTTNYSSAVANGDVLVVEPVVLGSTETISITPKETLSLSENMSAIWTNSSTIYKVVIITIAVLILLLVVFAIWAAIRKSKMKKQEAAYEMRTRNYYY